MLQKKSFYHMNDHKISKWGYKMDQYMVTYVLSLDPWG